MRQPKRRAAGIFRQRSTSSGLALRFLGLDRAGNLFVPGCPERVLFAAVLIWISLGGDVFARSALALLEWIGIAAHNAVFPGFTIRSLLSCPSLSNVSP